MSQGIWNGKRVLITGGLGFIGSNLAARLVAEGARVTLVDSLIPEYGGNLRNIHAIRDQVTVNISDVRDAHSFKYLIEGQDCLFNLAGQTSHLDSIKDPYTDLEINARAQLSILEACRHHNPGVRIVFASTRQVYGRAQYLPVDEKHPLRPVDVNGVNKVAGEQYHLLYNDIFGIKACALRLTNTYGPHMRIKDARQTFLGVWVGDILLNRPFEVWVGDQLRDFNYIDDVVEALMLAMFNPAAEGKVFNLGGSERVRLLDLADLLVRTGQRGSYSVQEFPAERKRIDIGDFYADYSLAGKTLSWKPVTRLAGGLAKTLAFFEANLKYYL